MQRGKTRRHAEAIAKSQRDKVRDLLKRGRKNTTTGARGRRNTFRKKKRNEERTEKVGFRGKSLQRGKE